MLSLGILVSEGQCVIQGFPYWGEEGDMGVMPSHVTQFC